MVQLDPQVREEERKPAELYGQPIRYFRMLKIGILKPK
jgi:hypothetical protein